MHFVKFHPEVASCLLSRGKRKYAALGMRLLWKYIRNYFLVYQLISHFLLYLQTYKKFEAEILDLQLEKYGLSFDIKKYTTSSWALGDENVIGIRSFNTIWNSAENNFNDVQSSLSCRKNIWHHRFSSFSKLVELQIGGKIWPNILLNLCQPIFVHFYQNFENWNTSHICS